MLNARFILSSVFLLVSRGLLVRYDVNSFGSSFAIFLISSVFCIIFETDAENSSKLIVIFSLNFCTILYNRLVIGEHGENMLPLTRFATVSGIPLQTILPKEKLDEIFTATKGVAAEVIKLKGATVHAPGNAISAMIESVVQDKKQVIPVSTNLDGEYGQKDVSINTSGVFTSNYEVKIPEGGTFDVPYTMKGGIISSMDLNQKNLSLVINIATSSDGNLNINLPRNSIDSIDKFPLNSTDYLDSDNDGIVNDDDDDIDGDGILNDEDNCPDLQKKHLFYEFSKWPIDGFFVAKQISDYITSNPYDLIIAGWG